MSNQNPIKTEGFIVKIEAFCFLCKKTLDRFSALRFVNTKNKVTLIACDYCFHHLPEEYK